MRRVKSLDVLRQKITLPSDFLMPDADVRQAITLAPAPGDKQGTNNREVGKVSRPVHFLANTTPVSGGRVIRRPSASLVTFTELASSSVFRAVE